MNPRESRISSDGKYSPPYRWQSNFPTAVQAVRGVIINNKLYSRQIIAIEGDFYWRLPGFPQALELAAEIVKGANTSRLRGRSRKRRRSIASIVMTASISCT